MHLTVNGEPRDVPDATTVAALVISLGAGPRGTAVAVDGCVVPRAEWATTALSEGAKVELVGAVQGG